LYNANDVCRFLVEQLPDSLRRFVGVLCSTSYQADKYRTSSHISPAPPLVSAGVYYGLKQLALDYVDLRGDSLTPGEFSTMLIAISSPARDVKTYVDYCKQRLSDRWKPFNLCLYSYLVSTFELWYNLQRYDIMDDWAPILADVLSNGVDIHTTTWLDERQLKELEGLSAVHRILASADSPQMAMERCRHWLDLLERVGVAIEQYLDVEIEHCTTTWYQKGTDMGTGFRKIFAIQEFGGTRVPCWTLEIDDICPIRELLLDFPHFQKAEIFRVQLGCSNELEMHRAWKDPAARRCPDGSSSWPFCPTLARTIMDGLSGPWQSDVIKQQIASLDWACYLMESRFERRQMRKLRKTGQRCPNRMPGAWVNGW
jgi:hypothetical protein